MLNPILLKLNTPQMCSLHDPNQTPAVVLVLTSFVTGSDLTGQWTGLGGAQADFPSTVIVIVTL